MSPVANLTIFDLPGPVPTPQLSLPQHSSLLTSPPDEAGTSPPCYYAELATASAPAPLLFLPCTAHDSGIVALQNIWYLKMRLVEIFLMLPLDPR